MICLTLAESYAAGWADGAADPPLTEQQLDRCAALLRHPTTRAAA